MQQTVIVKRNQGECKPELLRNECLHQIFEVTADQFPHQIALICDQESMTYEELEWRANQLAFYLRKKGVKRGSRVAILLERSFEQYIAILAIIKAGAAYVPLDPSYPEDRIAYILEDCQVAAIVTARAIKKQISSSCTRIYLDQEALEIEAQPTRRLLPNETGVGPTDLCYIIYTSGSTGRPKGVMIEHRNVCHFVRAAQTIYQITPQDRIYQGFTTAFDASVEEIWMAFSNGAALVVGTPTFTQAGNLLPKLLTEAGVTVLSCVPTLLTMFNEDIPTLRLLIVGGEDCPKSLVKRWTSPNRRMINTYGPTEATVIATYAECHSDKPVTIGKPLPNYEVYVLDEELNEVPDGEPGELHIGGPGLARGYVNRDDLTRERFISCSFADRLYKTGDLVRYDKEGNLVFLGRIDRQVKLRGFRVELSEIEEVLLQSEEVQQAAVSVHEQAPGLQVLVAYVVPRNKGQLDRNQLHFHLKDRLPAYMVPTYIEIMEELPVLVSGKIDYKNLPPPSKDSVIDTAEYIPPKTPIEIKVASVWQEVLNRDKISVESDFFQDLGGHSLFAALVISKLRQLPSMENLAISHLYRYPKIRKLSNFIEKNQSKQPNTNQKPLKKRVKSVSSLIYKLTGMAQAITIYFRYLIAILPLLIPYLFVTQVLGNWTWYTLLIGIAVEFVLYLPTIFILAILSKWLLIGRYRAGTYPLWGGYYLRWWISNQFQSLVPLAFISGTPLINLYYRLMGAKVGKNVYIGTEEIHSYDLIEIGDNTSIGTSSQLLGYTVRDGHLVIGHIKVGANAYIGANAVLSPNVVMEDGAQLGEQSLLSENCTIPAQEYWVGSPAERSQEADPELLQLAKESDSSSSNWTQKLLPFGFLLGILVLIAVPLISLTPGMMIIYLLFPYLGNWQLLGLPLCAAIFIIMLLLQVSLIKRILLGKVKEGQYSLHSFFYVRKWLIDKLLLLSLYLNNSLYATVYTAPVLRLFGAKIGKRVEVSTVNQISPELLTIEDESFVADAASVGAPKIYMNKMLLSETKIGYRTFIGNSAHINGGEKIGNHILLGVLSFPPKDKPMKEQTSWLGSPAIYLPRRDVNTNFSETETYRPTKRLVLMRYLIEFCRVTLPGTISIGLLWAWLNIATFALTFLSVPIFVLLSPILNLALALGATLLVVLMKIGFIGSYKKMEKPLWSTYVWRSELITALYENVTVPLLVNFLLGTPFVGYVLRLFGVKVGKRVYLGTTYLSEFDLVTIEDYAMINDNTTLQTHQFEDRVMKMSSLTIGKHCTVGNGSVVLYDTKMHAYSTLGNLSLLMKGESLPAHTAWEGVPARVLGNGS